MSAEDTTMGKKKQGEQKALEVLKKKASKPNIKKKNSAKRRKCSINNPSHQVETTWQSFAKHSDPPEHEKEDAEDSDTEFYPQKRTSNTERPSKISKTSTEGGLSRIERIEKKLSEHQELFKTLQSELQTHTEAIQGLMQVVSTPQNLANFQQQYAYSQLGTRSPNNSAAATPQPQQVQYMPVFYPQPMYYQQMQQQQAANGTPPVVMPVKVEEADPCANERVKKKVKKKSAPATTEKE